MNIVGLLAVIALAAGGVRSFLYWSGRGIDGTGDTKRLTLFAAFVAGRVGFWFGLSGVVAILSFVDNPAMFRWSLVVPGLFAMVQIVSAYMLGRDAPHDEQGEDRPST